LQIKPLTAQAEQITQVLRGHSAYDGVGGTRGSLPRLYRRVDATGARGSVAAASKARCVGTCSGTSSAPLRDRVRSSVCRIRD
jgi:hypothetical protein